MGRVARGITTIPVSWQRLAPGAGSEQSRQIWGIAYNSANKGPRKRVTCSEETWNDPDNRVFYADESVALTVEELRGLNLAGVPMRVQHNTNIPPVGHILGNWVDKEGRLWIHAEVPAASDYHKEMIRLIDEGKCADLSISYGVYRDEATGEVFHESVDEISFVTEGHFRGCRVGVKASNAKNDMVPSPRTEFRFVTASLTSMSAPAPTPATATSSTGNNNTASAPVPDRDDLMAQNTRNAQESLQLRRQLEEANKKLKEIEDARIAAEEEKKKKEEAAREKYRQERLPEAQEVVRHLVEQLLEENVELSDDWKKVNLDMLTSTEPLARQSAAAQIACSKKIMCQRQIIDEKDKELEELRARAKELEDNMRMANLMSKVESAAFGDDDAQYNDRRQRAVLAGAQKGQQQQQQQKRERSESGKPAIVPADWLRSIMGRDYDPSASSAQPQPQQNFHQQQQQQQQQQRRPVEAAGASNKINNRKPLQKPKQEEEEEDEEELQSSQKRRGVDAAGGGFRPAPMRPGFPVNAHSSRNNPRSNFFLTMTDVMQNSHSLEGAGGRFGGFSFDRPDF